MTVSIFVIPLATIVAIVFFSLLGLSLWMRQRRRERTTVFVPPQNYLMPMQPTSFNSVNPQYRTPMSVTQPNPYPYVANPMPTHQPFSNSFSPAPISVPSPAPPNANTATVDSELMDRMRQVQVLMVEIHRLESDSREGNHQRLQELKQRVAELSATDGRMPSNSFPPPPGPPAYYSSSTK